MLTARTNVWIYYISGGDERQEKREQMYGGNFCGKVETSGILL
ncbi:hypothetical protein MTIN_11970 [Moorella thermoacetica]|nr:hypothetical protein MTIN_11970 [Moorella thermoacetica]